MHSCCLSRSECLANQYQEYVRFDHSPKGLSKIRGKCPAVLNQLKIEWFETCGVVETYYY